MITITQRDLQLLADIYNMLFSVHYTGDDIYKASDALRALQNFVLEKNKELEANDKESDVSVEG